MQTWWRAEGKQGEWLETDLEQVMDVRAVQINFADDALPIESPGKFKVHRHSRVTSKSRNMLQDGRWKDLWMESIIL